MGILDFIFGKKKDPSTEESSISKQDEPSVDGDLMKIVIKDYDEPYLIKVGSCAEKYDGKSFASLVAKAIMSGKPYFYYPREKWEKALLEKERRERIDLLLNQTASLNNRGIELEKAGDINNAILTYDENVKLYEDNIGVAILAKHQFDRLVILYHKLKDIENEKRILIKAVEYFPNDTGYQKKLAMLNGTYETKEITSAPKNIVPTKNWGEIWEKRILEVPEFDFYYERDTNPGKYEYSSREIDKILSPIWEVQRHFKELDNEAKAAEDKGEQKAAVQIFEQMIAEGYYMPSPYDRLIKIYSKAKLKDDEIRMLKLAIAHFKQLRENQKEYIMQLAQKYDAVDFVNERIRNGKKITYYKGVFELYNPFPIIERWEARLQKLLK